MKKILFVCIGNLCRSPIAEYFFNHHNENEDWTAISAGIENFIDSYPQTTNVMKEKNIDLTTHKSKVITDEMLDEADVIYALAPEVIEHLPKEKTKNKFLRDPYYHLSSYEEIRDEIEEMIKEIIETLK